MRVLRVCTLLMLIILVDVAAGVTSGAGEESGSFVPMFDLRLRQESLDGVYHFASEPNRNWIRCRTRAGLKFLHGDHEFSLRLNNEHRHYLTPDTVDFDWDEVILDRAQWAWKPTAATTLILGRQDIIWNRGFLMLEGHPLDGSRSIYHNAFRVRSARSWGELDLALIHNPKRDPIVVVDDQGRAICDADETALALRLSREKQQWTVIWKDENDPDGILPTLQTYTLAGRFDGMSGANTTLMGEVAVQYQDGGVGSDGIATTGWATALQGAVSRNLCWRTAGRLGFFYYSGLSEDMLPFRTPWGKWPKWSELYIYTLIAESEPGRVHVAAWENIAAPHVTMRRPLCDRVKARFSAYYLLAPEPDWTGRGVLSEAELRVDLAPGLTGHLVWEMFVPGSFHDGDNGLPPLETTVHFIRWQLTYAFK